MLVFLNDLKCCFFLSFLNLLFTIKSCKVFFFSLEKHVINVTHFWSALSFHTPLKTRENLWFSCVFRGYKLRALARNGFVSSKWFSNDFPTREGDFEKSSFVSVMARGVLDHFSVFFLVIVNRHLPIGCYEQFLKNYSRLTIKLLLTAFR